MADFSCPGAKLIKQPAPEIVKCPSCGSEVEIWSDETKAKCPNCKKIVTRDLPPSCIEWCEYAKQCLGEEAYNKYMKEKNLGKKEK